MGNDLGVQAFDDSVVRIVDSAIKQNKIAGLNFHDSILELSSSEVSKNEFYGVHLHGRCESATPRRSVSPVAA